MIRQSTTRAAVLILCFALCFLAGYLPTKLQHRKHMQEVTTRLQYIHGEGDTGLMITNYILTGETTDQMGYPASPAYFWTVIQTSTPYNLY